MLNPFSRPQNIKQANCPENPRRPFRFSLRTLLIGVLFCGSAGAVWKHWAPWRVDHVCEHGKGLRRIELSRDGTRLMSLSFGSDPFSDPDVGIENIAKIWNTHNGTEVTTVRFG